MKRRLTAALFVFFASRIPAQTVTVHLINGENGKPIGDKNLTIIWDSDFSKVVVPIDKNGTGRFQVVAGKTSFSMMEGPKGGTEPGRIAYLDCNAGSAANVPLKQVIEKGFVPGNTCSTKVSADAKAGEVIFFAKLIPRWMPDMQ
jgi:hypothetical protein